MNIVGMGVLFGVLAIVFWQWFGAESLPRKHLGTDDLATAVGPRATAYGSD